MTQIQSIFHATPGRVGRDRACPPKLQRRWKTATFLALALCLSLPTHAESFLNASAADAAPAYEVGPNTYSRQRETDTNINVGRQGTNGAFHQAVVFPFQLPNFGNVAAPFTNAEFIFRLGSKDSVSGFNLDLYGLPSRTSSAVLPSSASTTNRGDFFMGGFLGGPADDNAAGVVKLQDNVATPSTPDGLLKTNSAANTQLAAYLNAQYNNGSGAGRWVFLRLSTDAVPGGGASRYNISATEQSTADNRPRIRYNFSETLYTRIGTDPTFQQLIDNGTIVPGLSSSPGPVNGSTIDVNNPLLEQQTGPTGPIAQDIRIHTQVNSSVLRSNFGNFTRWYQEDGNVQVMRLFEGEQNVRSGIGPEGTPGRIEAYFPAFTVPANTWSVWEATYTIIEPLQSNIFQLFHEGGQLWAFHLRMTSAGAITFNRRNTIAGLPTNLTIATDMVGKSIGFRVRANGRSYELYKKVPNIDPDWVLLTTGVYTQAVNNQISFRWGMYYGSQPGQSIPNDGLLFVSGVTRSSEPKSGDDPPSTPPPPVTYYWDNSGATAGFGTASGVWGETTTGGTTQGWSTSSAGTVVPGDVSTNATDPLFFGTNTTGLGAGTITVSDTVSCADITFGSQSGSITLNGGEIQMFGSRKITVGGGFHTIRSVLTGDSTRTIGGSGTLVLTGQSTFDGPLVIGDDTNTLRLRISSIANADGTPSAAGAPITSTNGIIQVGAVSRTSTLELSGSTAPQSTNRRIRIGSDGGGSGNAVIQNNNTNAANTLSFTNSAFNAAAGGASAFNRTLTLGGSNTGDNTIQGAIVDNSSASSSGGNIALVKNGTGTWVLSGASSYSGSTTIENGILKLAGGNNRLPTSTNVTLGDGTNTAQLDLNGRNQQIARLSIASGATAANNSVTNSSATLATLTVNPATANTFTGVLTGNLGLTKTGAETFTVSGTNSYTGPTTVGGGTLRAGAAAGGRAFGNLSAIVMADTAGATLSLNNFNQTVGSLAGGGTTGGTITLGSATLTTGGANTSTSFGGTITGTGGIIKTGTGTQTITGTNSYLGDTSLVGGKLQLDGGDNRLPVATRLFIGNADDHTEFDLNGRNQEIAGLALRAGVTTPANNAINNSSGTISTLRIHTAVGSPSNYGGALAGNLALTKTGADTLTLSGLSASAAQNHSGPTTIAEGTLAITTNNPALSGPFIFGVAAGADQTSTFDLTNASATIAGAITAQTNSTTANTIALGSGRTLQLNGAVTVGYNTTVLPHSVTRLDAAGAGAIAVGTSGSPNHAGIQIGAGTTSNVSNAGILDLSGLASFSAHLDTGTFRIGSRTNSGGQAGSGSTAILASNTAIDAAEVTMAAPDTGAIQTLRLGGGTNEILTNTLNVGGSASGDGRSSGQLVFNSATGTLRIRSQADPANGRAALNVGNITMNTGVSSLSHLFDTTGHSADLRFSTVTIGSRASTGSFASGNVAAEFRFDSGTLDADNLVVGNRTGSGSNPAATATGVVAIGGGTVLINNTSGPVQLGTNSFTNGTGSGTLHISGGNVTIAANGGNSILLGNATAAGGTATGTLNLTGGTLTVAGHIVRGATTGTGNATLFLNGPAAILEMGGRNITGLTNITFTDGTLRNLGTINTGLTLAGSGSRVFDQGSGVTGTIQGAITGSESGLTKQGNGTLVLTGTNTYSGPTTVNSGILRIDNATALNGTSGITVNSGTNSALAVGTGIITGAGKTITINGGGPANIHGALTSNGGTSEWQGNVAIGSAETRIGINSTNASQFTISGVIDSGGQPHGLSLRTRSPNSTIVLSGANTYLGETRIFGDGGSVRLSGGANRLPTTTTLRMGFGSTSGILDLNGRNQEVAALVVGQTSGTGANEIKSALPATLTINTAAPSSYSGAITGAIILMKKGADTLTLTGASTYTGSTTVDQGTLALAGASLTSPVSVEADASLGFTLGAPATSTSSIDLANGTVKITGTVDGSSDYLLITAAGGITGTPILHEPIPNYSLTLQEDRTKLVLTYGIVAPSYQTWSAGAQPAGDQNGDGVPNAIAWVLGAANPDENAIDLLPTIDNTSDPDYLIFSFTRSEDAAADPNTTIAVEYDSDLGGWTTAEHDGENIIISNNPGNPSPTVNVKLKRSTLAATGRLFVRLRATIAPAPPP